IHFSLQLLGRDRLLPLLFEQFRFAHIICDLLLDLRLRHHRLQRWLWASICFWPEPMPPVNFFDCPLIRDAIRETQGSVLVSIRAEASVIRRRDSLGRLLG